MLQILIEVRELVLRNKTSNHSNRGYSKPNKQKNINMTQTEKITIRKIGKLIWVHNGTYGDARIKH